MASFAAVVVRRFSRHMLRPWLMAGGLDQQRRRFARLAAPRRAVRARIEPARHGDLELEWLIPDQVDPQRVRYYLHGGAFVACSVATHRESVARMARAARARALMPEYRLAPEHPFPAALEDCVAGYRFLLQSGIRPEHIVIAGDSAGGALTLGTLLSLRDAGDPLPGAAVLLSPATDATLSGQSFSICAEREAMLAEDFCRTAVRLYLGTHDPRAPLASPLFADLRGLPALSIHVGTEELLLDDSLRLADRARAAGVETSLRVWDGMWHVFHMFPIPEAAECVREIGAFARAHFDTARREAAADARAS